MISADSRQVYKYLDIGTNKEGEWNEAAELRYAGGIARPYPIAYREEVRQDPPMHLFIAEVEHFSHSESAPLLFHSGAYFALGSRL